MATDNSGPWEPIPMASDRRRFLETVMMTLNKPQPFEQLGQALRRMRLAKGLRQSELAAAAGLAPEALCRYEADQVGMTVRTLGRILLALDADLATLGLVLAEVVESSRASAPATTGEAL